jgi:hypothetical protein
VLRARTDLCRSLRRAPWLAIWWTLVALFRHRDRLRLRFCYSNTLFHLQIIDFFWPLGRESFSMVSSAAAFLMFL